MAADDYVDSQAVSSAIKAAARSANQNDPDLNIDSLIRQAAFDRFLCRIFSEREQSEWLLKGGTGMLARVPNSRATLDIDLYRSGYTIDGALTDLRKLATVDLRDHFHFVYAGHERLIRGENQPYIDGLRVTFAVYVGVTEHPKLHVDIAVGGGLTDSIDVIEPANRLNLPRLTTYPYRLYPVVDQIADKVCATMELHANRSSTREKDLVDLVVLAVTQDIAFDALNKAIRDEAARRGLPEFTSFSIPNTWGRAYQSMTTTLRICEGYERIDQAAALMDAFINPVLQRNDLSLWRHELRYWR
jgi:hypothetical protein